MFECRSRITLPAETKSIEDCAFTCCNSLTEIILPAKVKQLTAGCFMYCYNLKSVYLQSTNRPKQKDALHGATDNAYFTPEWRTWGAGLFQGNNKVNCKGLININNKEK